ncbi:NAD(P)H-binding protein [Nocardia sp. NPDC049220]|uniref:NAD(P)H-binding protein n=1 Tax=Nocardia sp. NPDC049220 TaxID=3155273 RepID=UPI0033E46360
MQNVLVIGATGKTGRQVVEALLTRGATVRAASRKPAPARDGVQPVVFDWLDRSTWAPTVAGAEAVYVVGPYAYPSAGRRTAEFLAAAGDTRRVVLLSAMGTDQLGSESPNRAAELAVQASGKAWTILRASWFHQNFSEGPIFPPMIEAGELVLAAGSAAVSHIDAYDIAAVAAVVLTSEGHEGQEYALSGPAALTFEQLAAELTRALGRRIGLRDVTPEGFVEQLTGQGLPAPLVATMTAVLGATRAGVFSHVTGTVEKLLGRAPRSFAEFATEMG